MDEPVELQELYFNWLCAKVIDTTLSSPGLTYWHLLETLYKTEFVWILFGDYNRAEDGKDLRREFLIVADIPDYPDWREIDCSVLEMLISFARRAEFMTDRPAREWFWQFMDNLDLKEYNDANFEIHSVGQVLDDFLGRTYEYNGIGGLFPLKNPGGYDQRTIEIWDQLCDYLVNEDS